MFYCFPSIEHANPRKEWSWGVHLHHPMALWTKNRSSLTEQTTPVALALSDTIAIVSWRKAVVKGRVSQWIGWPFKKRCPLDIMLNERNIHKQSNPKFSFSFLICFLCFIPISIYSFVTATRYQKNISIAGKPWPRSVHGTPSEVSNVSFVDFDLDLTELGGPITWDGSDVPEAWMLKGDDLARGTPQKSKIDTKLLQCCWIEQNVKW